jgi:hypothetical protein
MRPAYSVLPQGCVDGVLPPDGDARRDKRRIACAAKPPAGAARGEAHVLGHAMHHRYLRRDAHWVRRCSGTHVHRSQPDRTHEDHCADSHDDASDKLLAARLRGPARLGLGSEPTGRTTGLVG